MPCDVCGERPAVIHLTQIVNSQVTKQHLCEVCAKAKGIQTDQAADQLPLADFLASLGGIGEALPTAPAEQGACGACGATLEDFRESGRLGCPICYTTFEESLRTLLRRIHGASRHIGRTYEAPGATPEPTTANERLATLRDALRRAIDAENFERAAELRDRLRAVE